MTDGGKTTWLDNERNVAKIVTALVAACIGVLVADLFVDTHGYSIGFFALMGFASYSFIVYAGHAVRMMLEREEDYYDE